ncbi:MAG: GNAT family N-acetyltransferase [Synechococcaceae cyanobacterium RL_1_2]|nr:GNAT family N-acetyltransferase [Synechococcaceae cyanobacterium RL_1_2]
MKHNSIQFSLDKDLVDFAQLEELFHATAHWGKTRTAKDLSIAIAHSNPVVTVWDGKKLIGFARGDSDGFSRATIWDVLIHPDYQGLGLGGKLVETLLAHPLMYGVEETYLMTTYKQTFYEKIGFQYCSKTTMVLQKSDVTSVAELLENQQVQADKTLTTASV